MQQCEKSPFVFPKWTNVLRPAIVLGVVLVPLYVAGIVYFGLSPQTTDAGYQPSQPVPFSHALHTGQLDVDCRYCHTDVDVGRYANLPSTQTCMNCHTAIHKDSPQLADVRESYAADKPIEWIRVHDLPDYVYFDHSAHVCRGVGCVSCHGRVDTMDTVFQKETLSMGWCLSCHRNPIPSSRPLEAITDMAWQADGNPENLGQTFREAKNLQPLTDCSTCHR